MNTIIDIKNLEKNYGEKKAVKHISFKVSEGEILCILGPNGAGKSTTINMITGALKYDSGSITSRGKEIRKNLPGFKKSLGIVPQDLALYEDLSAWQNVKFFASLYGLKGSQLKQQCEYALSFTGLSEHASDKVNTFSGGMKRRLNIACAIAHEPELIVMDEPTVGIDPQSRNHILSSIKKLRKNGTTIIYTTHYMEEVEEISTRIIIMDMGEIIASGTKEEIKESVEQQKFYQIETDSLEQIAENEFYKIEGIKDLKQKENTLEITSLAGVENLDRIIAALLRQKMKIQNISCTAPSLETVFLNLTGKKLRN